MGRSETLTLCIFGKPYNFDGLGHDGSNIVKISRDYLERTIVISKGSVERAKLKLDKICTFRTIYPQFFGPLDVRSCKILNDLYSVFLPQLTSDFYRVYVLKCFTKSLDEGLLEYFRYFFMQCEYIQAHDYCNGLVLILDYSKANIMEIVKAINLNDVTQVNKILKEGYGMRIKEIHFITDSKAIDTLVSIFKQILSEKIAKRIFTHKTINTVYDYVPKDIMPEDYGGKEVSTHQLHHRFLDVLTSEHFSNYLLEMNEARTDENLRQADGFEQHLGVPGTFRKLNAD